MRGLILLIVGMTGFGCAAYPPGLPDKIPAAPRYDRTTRVLVRAVPIEGLTDLDRDRAVTDADFRKHFEEVVGPTVLIEDHDDNGVLSVHDEVASVAAWIGSRNDQLSLPDRRRFALDLLGNMRGTMTHVLYAQGHNGMISSHSPGHRVWGSRQMEGWPPNHGATYSATWKDGRGTAARWPARHLNVLSSEWYQGREHRLGRSMNWPALHGVERSDGWYPEGSSPHFSSMSSMWPPDHDRSDSHSHLSPTRRSAHEWQYSKLVDEVEPWIIEAEDWREEWLAQPPGASHWQRLSASWDHGIETSQIIYPSGHHNANSAGWVFPWHAHAVSGYWPANHYYYVSTGWPWTDLRLPNWPANHGAALSRTWSDSAVPPPGWNGRRKPVEPKPLGELMGHANSQTSGDIDPTTPPPPATAWAELFMTLNRDKSES